MKCEEIIAKLEELSPLSFACNWDNVGLQVGRKEKEIKSVYIALDVTDEVVDEAISLKADLLLTHHPMIFTPMKRITSDHFIGRRVIKLIQNDICYYAMHTNFDVMGMADAAADEIQLRNRKVLDVTFEDEIAEEGFGRYGKLPKIMTLRECGNFVKERFGVEHIKVFGDLDAEIETAAISPGSGKSMISSSLQAGADVLITGDIDHHEGLDATEQGMFIIDAGHFSLEKIFISFIEEYLKREIPSLVCYKAEQESPFTIL